MFTLNLAMSWLVRYRSYLWRLRDGHTRYLSVNSPACSNQHPVSSNDTNDSFNEPLVLEQSHGDVALIGINRPRVRNCVNLDTGAALRAALERFDKDDGLKSAVLHGVGGNFCAGFDLKELSELDSPKNDDGDEGEGEDVDEFRKMSLVDSLSQRAIADPLFRPMGPSKMLLSKVGCLIE